ncbi:MAG: hypothetical protein AABX79_00985 [Nanoarchaeota archaeon]
MNILIVLVIAVLIIAFLAYKWNNARTKIAFFFIIFGFLFLLLLYFMLSGRLDFSDLGQASSSVKGYFLSAKGFAVKVFETTGRVIGRFGSNSTG